MWSNIIGDEGLVVCPHSFFVFNRIHPVSSTQSHPWWLSTPRESALSPLKSSATLDLFYFLLAPIDERCDVTLIEKKDKQRFIR
ncbi:hypothetical protein BD777DRAFT_131454 [Yarrowia lipolytica]|nr:hypothetical protein BD777DRAFT_131454 [Yarrowia lipolytica]